MTRGVALAIGVLALALQVTMRKRCEYRNAVFPRAINVADRVADSRSTANKEAEAVARHRISGGRGDALSLMRNHDDLHVTGRIDRVP